jgi:hypothetical protein
MQSGTAQNIDSAHWQLYELEALADEMKQLLGRNSPIPGDADMREELEVLERWRDHFHRNMVSADAFFETGKILLANFHDHLKLAIVEKKRLEYESGRPASPEQAKENEGLLKALRITERILNR